MSTQLAFTKATKVIKQARIGLCGVSGSGKTLSALKVAGGLGKRIALVDTENNSSVLYGDRVDFDVLNLEPPFEIEKYITAIHIAEQAGYDVLILDTISHAWAGEGGLLDTQGKMADGGMNSFTAWRKLTPQHNAFVEAMIRSKIHIIATMRSKMEYVVETNERGKSAPRKVGLAPVQREGMDYEFDIVFDLDLNHNAISTKDRSSLFDGKIFTRPDEAIGRKILEWLNKGQASAGVQAPVTPKSAPQTKPTRPALASTRQVAHLANEAAPLFDNAGRSAMPEGAKAEAPVEAMMKAIAEAATLERLLAIDKSRRLGFDTGRLTQEESSRIREAIERRDADLRVAQREQAA